MFGDPALVFRRYSRLSILNEELGKRRAEYEREMKEKRAG